MPPSRVVLGSRVSGLVGPFVHQPGRTRRSRARFTGLVLRSVEGPKWTVYWESINKCADHAPKCLRVEDKQVSNALANIDVDDVIRTTHVGDQRGIDRVLVATGQMEEAPAPQPDVAPPVEPPPPIQTPAAVPLPNAVANTTAATQAPDEEPVQIQAPDEAQAQTQTNEPAPTNAATAALAAAVNAAVETVEENEEADPDLQLEDDVYDPNSILLDMMEDRRDGRHLQRYAEYLQEKLALVGKEVIVRSSGNRNQVWKVRHDVKKEEAVDKEYKEVGVKGFDFNKNKVKCGPRNANTRINFLKLLIHLWPGDWREQVRQLNLRIKLDNAAKRARANNRGYVRLVQEISEREFWIFWGIIIKARLHGRKGSVWDKHEPEGDMPKVDVSEYMRESRHREMRHYISYLWASNKKKDEGDTWWQFSEAVEEFNKNRRRTVLGSFLKLLDESMSVYRPRTTKTGNLHHLSNIQRKPEPLGTKFKVVACAILRMTLHLEIQRCKDEMRMKEFCGSLKATSACTARLAKYTTRQTTVSEEESADEGVQDTYLGDSWFASLSTVAGIKEYGRFIGVVKTAHSQYPKKWLEKTMKDWPAGSHLVLESVFSGVPVIAMGYKYNKRKVICFVATKGAWPHRTRAML